MRPIFSDSSPSLLERSRGLFSWKCSSTGEIRIVCRCVKICASFVRAVSGISNDIVGEFRWTVQRVAFPVEHCSGGPALWAHFLLSVVTNPRSQGKFNGLFFLSIKLISSLIYIHIFSDNHVKD